MRKTSATIGNDGEGFLHTGPFSSHKHLEACIQLGCTASNIDQGFYSELHSTQDAFDIAHMETQPPPTSFLVLSYPAQKVLLCVMSREKGMSI